MKKSIFLSISAILTLALLYPGLGMANAESANVSSGTVSESDMLQQPLDDMDQSIEEAISNQVMPGAVALVAKDGGIVKHDAYGYAARYKDDDFTDMQNPRHMKQDTIFDLASLSKLFTVTAAMQLWDQDRFSLSDPVADYIPEFATNGKGNVTIRQLMTHTSGFKPWIPLYTMTDTREEAIQTVLEHPLEHDPGTHYAYSDLNVITLGVLVEKLTDKREDDYVKDNITKPLNMTDTMYNPPDSLRDRIAATEYQPSTDRGLVWGSVHDENAWALDGVAGHAGVFSTAQDLSIFGQMMLNKGTYEGEEILSEEAVDMISTNWNEDFPGQDHGLGWELNQEWYMDDLAEDNVLGHTGFTGTSIVVSPNKDTVVILLTNRVHPSRDTPSTNPIRRDIAGKTAHAIYAYSADMLKKRVEYLEGNKEIKNDAAAHALKMHLTAVDHYENAGATEKMSKHMKGFKKLLDYQRNNELISEDAYQTLKVDAGYLIEK